MRFFVLWLICVSASIKAQNLFDPLIYPLLDNSMKPFYFGVASGDPQPHSVIIWTKAIGENSQPVPIKWQVATDTTMQNIVANGNETANASSAYSIKIEVKNLQPGTTYFYRFESGNTFSPIGRTKTAPVIADSLKFAVVSCSNYEQGYFNAYRLIANRHDVDAVIHLGDYIYEYGAGKIDGKRTVRTHIPTHEILSLQDYRSRYAQYRLDKDLQEVHRLHPFITEWDDHEFANNTYKEGAKNHQSDEGDWETRKAIARKVYFEWLPITENEGEKVTRKISYGNLADLFMLDGRVEGRSKQGNGPYDTIIQSAIRTMLGRPQSDWLTRGILKSQAKWKVIGNQVVFSEVDAHQLTKEHAINEDAWDGYPVERQEIMDSFYAHSIKNLIVITGDIHLSWAFDLVQNPKDKNKYNSKTGKGVIGAEFVTPSVSTNGLGERFPRGLAKLIGSILKRKSTNPHLRFQNLVNHGYILLDLNNEHAKATWNFCKTVRHRSEKFFANNSWLTKYDENRLVKTGK